MAKVIYKFTFNSEIDFPESIEFDGISADIENDNKGDFIIQGEVEEVALDENGKLPIYVSTSGQTGASWELEVTFATRKLNTYPITGTIKGGGFYTLNRRYKLQS